MDLVGDERAQSIQVGAVLLFAILIVAFSSYQAFVVPNQNRQVEFNHYTDSQADMEEIRNAVINSGQSGSVVSESFSLGTNYPSRLVASQPERTYGSLRASPIGSPSDITIQGASENASTICGPGATATRSITYRPEYFYLDSAGDITYENTIVYTSGRQGGKAIQTEQQLVDNKTIQLYPLLGNYSESGGGVTSIPFTGGTTGEVKNVSGSFTVTLPTKLSADQWNNTLLEDEVDAGFVADVTANGSQAVDIAFNSSKEYTIRCSPTGTRGNPSNAPTVDDGSGDGSGDSDINPAEAGDIRFEGERLQTGTSSDVLLSLNNTANGSTNITEARINFYQSAESSATQTPTRAVLRNPSGADVATLQFGDSLTRLDSDIELPANTVTEIELDFQNDDKTDPNLDSDSWFVLTISIESGQQATYFVSIPE